MAEKRLSVGGGRQRGDFTGHASLPSLDSESAFKLIMTQRILKMPDERRRMESWSAREPMPNKQDSIENSEVPVGWSVAWNLLQKEMFGNFILSKYVPS